ncbi:DNA-binding protein [Paraburkholderia monticola]|uniref:DNA-binding protein n=1 Tax=Paraburkholderia monticola TaxID=1399968 RepID=A0A149PFF2_9BURK|nr:HU family DNA-binding protein [Paraburkholderia monticola]KXU83769.1 DNA-binding protein [Paraburkholderia monticola]
MAKTASKAETKLAKTAPKAAAKAAKAEKAAPAAKKGAVKAVNGTAKKLVAGAPVKEKFTKASLAAHVATAANVEPKAAKAVLAALEDTILGTVHKKGAGEFTLSGLLKISVQQVPAKKRRFGKDPFTGEERWFDAKPASVRIKARALKKLKDAAA